MAEAPAHNVDTEALTFKVGATLTVIVFDSIAEQPPLFVPVTEYVVVAVGLTVMDDEVAPLLHK